MKTEQEPAKKRKRRPFRWFMGLFGIQFPQEKGRWILLTKRFFMIVLAMIVLLISGMSWFLFYYGNQPEFCSSCHLMESYMETWRTSAHSEVKCVDCHISPGISGFVRAKTGGLIQLIKTVAGDETATPHAEVSDASCLRSGCHETQLLDSEVLFKGKYPFSHTSHLTKLRKGKILRCTSCHSQVDQSSHFTVTQSTCFTCHLKRQDQKEALDSGCTSCHQSPTEPIKTTTGIIFDHTPFLERDVACWKCHFDGVQGTGEVAKQVCRTCHRKQEKLEKFEDSEFIHNWHVTQRKIKCFQCHGEIRHGLHPTPGGKDSSCATCHSGGHGTHGNLYAGRGGLGIPDSPGAHFQANVDCVACHETPNSEHGKSIVDTVTSKVTEQACLSCHGNGRKGTLGEWKSALDEALTEAKEELAKAQKAYANQPKDDPSKTVVKKLLETARHNCEFMEQASGVHNLNYALDLLEKALDNAREALEIAEKSIIKAKSKSLEK